MVTSLTTHQREVLRAFHEFEHAMDDQTLATYVHHISSVPMSSSSIRSRRAELSRDTDERENLLEVTGTKRLKSGRYATVFGLSSEGIAVADELFEPITSLV